MSSAIERYVFNITSILQISISFLIIVSEFLQINISKSVAEILTAVLIIILFYRAELSRKIFVVIGIVLIIITWITKSNWLQLASGALGTSALITAFLTALLSIRNASETSKQFRVSGHFLASQPPGRRYLSLTLGGQAFGLVLNFGALFLLGQIAVDHARTELNPEIRQHRIRRMLLAIQRGFVSTMTWSPLALSTLLSFAYVRGANWGSAFAPCLVSTIILLATGWALDSLFKPKVQVSARPTFISSGSWTIILPIIALFLILVTCISAVHFASGVRVVGATIIVVPLVSIAWIILQDRNHELIVSIRRHATQYLLDDLPEFRSELLLIIAAGLVGSLAAALLQPALETLGIDFSIVPGKVLMVLVLWIIPLAGQLGMNPILFVPLIGPLIPDADTIGVAPNAVVVALTAGWALSVATSPYSAATAFISTMSGKTAFHVGVVWNGLYAIVAGVLLSAWVVTYATLSTLQ